MLPTDWLFHHSTLSNLSPLKPLLVNGPMGTLWVCLCLFSCLVGHTLAGPWVGRTAGWLDRVRQPACQKLGPIDCVASGTRNLPLRLAANSRSGRASHRHFFLSQRVTVPWAFYVPRVLPFVSCNVNKLAPVSLNARFKGHAAQALMNVVSFQCYHYQRSL
ncbi:hypothetical protein EG68_05753 [Paragonimus skrjabini miyazakii]|uniref:Uncharacterized protein n=1 Tax=Paragonimus skrjabini miyazakii TaxID=59628 RepID=A0A8S9YV28_9TREM|nr:hypothetical protein EG68_05753 [Paragonimus skrjabini miyazakii]